MTKKKMSGQALKNCVECGAKKSPRDTNPYWCPECNAARIARITSSLEAMIARLDAQEPALQEHRKLLEGTP